MIKTVTDSNLMGTFEGVTKKGSPAHLFWSAILLSSSVSLGITLSATPAHAGCATYKGIARISDRETGKTIQQLKHVQIYECGNSWSSLGGYMTGQTKTGWMKCTKDCPGGMKQIGYNVYFEKKEYDETGFFSHFAISFLPPLPPTFPRTPSL
jgi:hypothetical protein